MKIGEGRGNPSEEGLPLSPPKTFDFIESLMAIASGLKIMPIGEKKSIRMRMLFF